MEVTVEIEHRQRSLEVPSYILEEGDDFFERMDRDMDGGWQMGAEWVEDPDTLQRCQIAAERLATALETDNQPMAAMMAAYILKRLPGTTEIRVDPHGEMQQTEFLKG